MVKEETENFRPGSSLASCLARGPQIVLGLSVSSPNSSFLLSMHCQTLTYPGCPRFLAQPLIGFLLPLLVGALPQLMPGEKSDVMKEKPGGLGCFASAEFPKPGWWGVGGGGEERDPSAQPLRPCFFCYDIQGAQEASAQALPKSLMAAGLQCLLPYKE